ncbi:MAG: hypothetical protein ACP6IS_11840 [Candidatus Asgardarchaeia archaeon]
MSNEFPQFTNLMKERDKKIISQALKNLESDAYVRELIEYADAYLPKRDCKLDKIICYSYLILFASVYEFMLKRNKEALNLFFVILFIIHFIAGMNNPNKKPNKDPSTFLFILLKLVEKVDEFNDWVDFVCSNFPFSAEKISNIAKKYLS